jgi:uncharacterized protein (DUF1330 family)
MPAYVCVEIDIHDPETYEEYKKLAPPSIAEYGGRYLTRGGRMETLEGDWQPKRFVILEFPTFDKARDWWHSEGYRDAKAMRHRSARSRMLLLEGLPDGWRPQ